MKSFFTKCLFFLTSITAFTSCTGSNKTKILRTFHDDLDSFIYVDDAEVQDLQKTNQDFILFLYSDCGCGGHTDLVINAFQEYIKESKQVIYAIGESDYKKLPTSLKDYFPLYPSSIKDVDKEMPSLYFYNDGQLKYRINYSSKLEMPSGIKKIIDKYTYINGFFSLNDIYSVTHKDVKFYKYNYESTILLDQTIYNQATVLFSWKLCSDCFSFKTYERRLFSDFTKKIYVFEVDYFRKSINKETLWNKEGSFPYKYDFASYRNGKVPVVVNYINNVKESMMVYRNDVIENGIIKESYYEELIGKSLSQSEIDDYQGNKIIEYIKEVTK